MHYDRYVYRPPSEANSLLLQVTVGCAHNTCTFCSMFKDTKFCVSPMAEIKSDILEAARFSPGTKRVFLLNGDAFVLSADTLLEIASFIHEHLPNVQTISTYASILNIFDKSVDQLKQLRAAGINELYIGLESGHDQVLANICKGYTSAQALAMMQRLDQAGIDYYTIILSGVAGKGLGVENALATAALLNQVDSCGVFPMSLVLMEGTKMYDQKRRGDFVEPSEHERLLEVKTLLENLTVKKPTMFSSQHNTNAVPLGGMLPADTQKFIQSLERIMESTDEARLNRLVNRQAKTI